MTTEEALEQVWERLRSMRRKGNFEGQLSTYKELGSLLSRQNRIKEAAEVLEKAARVANYLHKPNETEAIYQSLIAVYELAGDSESVIRVYSLLHIHFNMLGDHARASQYNKVRLELVAKLIGKNNPSFEERFKFEAAIASKSVEQVKEQYARLLRGDDEPTVPDEHVEACNFLVSACLTEKRYEDALQYVSTCQKAMQNLGIWASPKGIEKIQELKQMVEQKKNEYE